MNTGNLEMSELVAPLAVTEEQPPPIEKQPKKESKTAPNAEIRTKIIQAITESPKETPDKVSSEKQWQCAGGRAHGAGQTAMSGGSSFADPSEFRLSDLWFFNNRAAAGKS